MALPATMEPLTTVPSPKVMADTERMEPSTTVAAPKTMAVRAIMEPSKTVPAPTVRVVPRAHETFSALAPFVRMILAPAPISIVVSDWKRNTESGSPCPSKVTMAPATIEMVNERQVPGVKIEPPISGLRISVTLSRICIAVAQTSSISVPNRVRSSTTLANSPSIRV
jgi:hypothetical protein